MDITNVCECSPARPDAVLGVCLSDSDDSDSSSSEQGWQALPLRDNRGLCLESFFRLGMFVHF